MHFDFVKWLVMWLAFDVTRLVIAAGNELPDKQSGFRLPAGGKQSITKKFHKTSNVWKNRSTSSKLKNEFLLIRNAKGHTFYAKQIRAQTGGHAFIACPVGRKRNYTISWLKKRENNEMVLLTVNSTTVSKDKRFQSSNEKDSKVWILKIKYTETADQGTYVCQICTKRTSTRYFKLFLIEAEADIFGGAFRTVKVDAPLRISCILRHTIEPPQYIFWYHDDRMINYDLGTGSTVRHGRLGSELIFPKAQQEHAGNYSCVPSNAHQASVYVRIEPAPKNGSKSQWDVSFLLVLVYCFLFS